MKRSGLRLATGLVLLTLLLVVGSAGVLLYTESGLYWALTRAAAALPGELVIARVEGRLLAGPITLHDVRYRQAGQELRVAQATFRWSPLALWRASVRIEQLRAEDIELRIARATDNAPLPDIQLPLRLEFADAQLRALRWSDGETAGTRIERLDFDITASGHDLDIGRLLLQSTDTLLELRGRLRGGTRWSVDARTRWQWQPPRGQRLDGNGRVRGDRQRISIDQQLTAPFPASLHAVVQEPLAARLWQLEGQFEKLPLAESGKLRGTLRARGDRDQWRIEEFEATVAGSSSRLHIEAEGRFDMAVPFAVTARWQDLAWPLTGPALASSPDGTVTLRGTPERYRFTLATRMRLTHTAEINVSGQGRGDQRGLDIERLQATGLDGQLDVDGSLHWQPLFDWQAQLSGRNLNPAQLWPDWPGQLAVQARTRGQFQNEWSASLDIDKLEGRVRGVDASLTTALRLDGQNYRISQLHLTAPGAELTADGELTDQWRAAWRVEIADLARLAAGNRGAVSSHGTLHGARHRPRLTAALTARGLHAAGYAAEQLDVNVQLDLADRQESQLHVHARDFAWPGYRLHELQLDGDGLLARHRLTATLAQEDVTLRLHANGSYDRERWQGQLQQLDLGGGVLGDWKLTAPVALHIGAHDVHLDPFCWTSNAARLCGEGSWQRRGPSRIALDASALPLALVGWLLPETSFTGQLDGSLRAELARGDDLRGELSATLTPGSVGYRSALGTSETIAHEGAQLRLRAQDRRLQGQTRITLPAAGWIALQGEWLYQSARSGPLHDASLRATLTAEINELGLLARWIPELEQPAGRLRADLAIGGTLDAPLLRGAVTLADGTAAIPRAGITLRELQASARSTDGQLVSIAFAARSGPGQLSGDGELKLVHDHTTGSLRLRVRGEDFETVKTQNAWLLTSPDLTIEARPPIVTVKGQVVIPRGRLTPRDLTAAQTESPDTIVVGAAPAAAASRPWAITSDIRLVVGDELHFEGFDFSGWVTGSVDLHDEPQRPTSGQGELRVTTGQYDVYGQRLTVERGRLMFRGGPIDDPALDVRAARRVGDVVAGVQASGTLKSPLLALYSEPPLDQTDILSYLLLGRPAQQASTAGGDTLYRAATALGLVGGEQLAKRIGTTFGIEEVRVEPGTTEASTSLVLGTYLAPRLYVSYGIGLFEAANTWRLRYQLDKRWQVEARSGIYTGADLLYSIER